MTTYAIDLLRGVPRYQLADCGRAKDGDGDRSDGRDDDVGGKSGLVLTPGLWTNWNFISNNLWNERSITNLDTLANLGVVYLMFFKGLQMDFTPIARPSRTTLVLSAALFLLPFAAGCGLYFLIDNKGEGRAVYLYWGTVMASTSFPSLAPILARLKLLCTDLGREALSLGMVNDVCCMFLLVLIIALSAAPVKGQPSSRLDPTIFVLLFTVLFSIFCMGVIRPSIRWLIKKTDNGESYSDSFIHAMFFMVLACGLVTEFFGAYSLLGAFMLGLCIPHGHLASLLIDRMEDCVVGVLMPLYFMLLSHDLHFEAGFGEQAKQMGVVFLTVFVKPLCGLLASFFCDVSAPDAVALGILLSAQGVVPVVIIVIGHERDHLKAGPFSGLLLDILFSTMIVGPSMELVYKRLIRRSTPYQRRTVEGTKSDADFRVVACIHSSRNISSIINLLKISDISPQSPMSVFALHLTELVGHAAAMFIVHESGNPSLSSSWGCSANSFFGRKLIQSDQVIDAFKTFKQEHQASTYVQTLTLVSSIDTMHEDISSLAEDKQATLILLPFHKQQGMDGKLEDSNIEFSSVNQNLMASAPCSVGLLVDRGLSLLSMSLSNPSSCLGSSSRHDSLQMSHARIAMIYVGGPDDREALSYAWRLSAHPLATLTVIRFVVGDNAADIEPTDFPGDDESGILTVMTLSEKEREIDDEFMTEFRERVMNDESIEYMEMVSNSGDETVNLLRGMEHDYDLYVVGRGQTVRSPLTVGLAEWSESPELGTIGDVLVTSDFASHVSVLVVQQYPGARLHDHGNESLYGATVMPFS
ncbi:Cation/H(+) antiporter 15-like protein [Drosera capensis]